MKMGLVSRDDGWRIPDAVWQRMEPLLPPRPSHPLGCHNPRLPDRATMNAILLARTRYSPRGRSDAGSGRDRAPRGRVTRVDTQRPLRRTLPAVRTLRRRGDAG